MMVLMMREEWVDDEREEEVMRKDANAIHIAIHINCVHSHMT